MTGSKARPQNLNPEMQQREAPAALLLALLVLLPIAVSPAWAQTFTVVHKFTGGQGGAEPPAGVVRDAAGNIYGVTELGGSFNFGTVFKLDTAGKETVLHSFLGEDGLQPVGGLIWDTAGNLYGTTLNGGTSEGGGCQHGCGTVFKRDKTGKQTVLYAFTGGADGGKPSGAVIRDAAGNIYGTTSQGGRFSGDCQYFKGCGVVFKLDKAGKETVLYSFVDGTDGTFPNGLVLDRAGNLYGTSLYGVASMHGNVFKLDKSGKFAVLYSFTGGADGAHPSSLIRDAVGNLYGIGSEGGDFSRGVVFKLNAAGKENVLYAFTGGADGEFPSSLNRDRLGNLYGTTLAGGNGTGCMYGGCGVVFKLDTRGTQTVLHSFRGSDGQGPNGLMTDAAGSFYGSTYWGGKSGCGGYGCGVVFKLTP